MTRTFLIAPLLTVSDIAHLPAVMGKVQTVLLFSCKPLI